jgi:hypothetical protein
MNVPLADRIHVVCRRSRAARDQETAKNKEK